MIAEDVFGTCGNRPSPELYHKTGLLTKWIRSSFHTGKRYLLRDCSLAASAPCDQEGCFVAWTRYEELSPGEQTPVEPSSGDQLLY
jgi:hypothetical protein